MAGRRAKRVQVLRRIPVGFQGGDVSFTADLVDISRSGLLVRCSYHLPAGTIGRVGISLGVEMFRSVVTVRRRVEPIGLAFEFTQMTQRDRHLLHRVILLAQHPPLSQSAASSSDTGG